MTDYKDPSNLSHSTASVEQAAVNIKLIRSTLKRLHRKEPETSHIHCPKCRSLTISCTKNSDDLLDPNGKRHFCSDVDRILHEEEWVIILQSLIQDYNQAELSNFQLELNLV
jgi:hypothetical protein